MSSERGQPPDIAEDATNPHDRQNRTIFLLGRPAPMGMTYFKRYRMELELDRPLFEPPACPSGYQLVPFEEGLIRDHAQAKYLSFRHELDVTVFPCLGRRDGCLRLMREIANRDGFTPEATWLLRYQPAPGVAAEAIGTVQGIQCEGWGGIQNLGISHPHRGLGLGTLLLSKAARGFRSLGLTRMHLEVTTDNTAAVRLYERLGFRRSKVLYKAAEVAMATAAR